MKTNSSITKKIINILLIILFIFHHQNLTVTAVEIIFKDSYGNSFAYDNNEWNCKLNNLGDGFITYDFQHKDGDVLQLSYQKLDADIRERDIKNLCKEGGSKLKYINSHKYNGNTWYQTEYADTAYFYYGSANKVLYRIGIGRANKGDSIKLAKNIMNGVSEKKQITNSVSSYSNNTSNVKQEAVVAGLIEGIKTIVLYSALFAFLRFVWKKIKSNRSSQESINITRQNKNNNVLIDFNNRIFPNNCREYIKKQMRILTKGTTTDDENIKAYIYCMTHYLVNGEDIEYVTKMLPATHSEFKDKEIINNIVNYTKMCSIGDPSKINVSDVKTTDTISTLAEEFKRQSINRKNNADKNKEQYDKNRGIDKEKPMYFAGARSAEKYLNSLTDEEGNKLHTGFRYSYSVDGIPELLDCYQMLDKNDKLYGELHLSIYGQDDYMYVPKGYRHPVLSDKTRKSINDEFKEEKENKDNPVIVNGNETIKNEEEAKKKFEFDSSSSICFCRKCGAKLSADSDFCHKCGTKVIRS